MQCHGDATLKDMHHFRVTAGLTLAWWSCAVAVTIMMKAALRGPSAGFSEEVRFPYPLTLTLFSNGCTAVVIESFIFLQGLFVHRVQARSPPLLPVACDRLAAPPADPAKTGAAAPPSEGVALAAMGLMQGAALGAKNEALLLLTVSSRTMVMATNVLVVMLLARLGGLERFGTLKLMSAMLIASGGAMQGLAHLETPTPLGQPANHPLGYFLAVIALTLDASRWVLLQGLFRRKARQEEPRLALVYVPPTPPASLCPPPSPQTPPSQASTAASPSGLSRCTSATSAAEERPCADVVLRSRCLSRGSVARASSSPATTKLRMVASMMWSTCPLMLVMSLVCEPAAMPFAWQRAWPLAKLVACLAFGVLGINLCEFGVVQVTSAVTFTILSNLHSIPMVLSGVLFFGEQVMLLQALGFLICIGGSLLYSRAKAVEAAGGIDATHH